MATVAGAAWTSTWSDADSLLLTVAPAPEASGQESAGNYMPSRVEATLARASVAPDSEQ